MGTIVSKQPTATFLVDRASHVVLQTRQSQCFHGNTRSVYTSQTLRNTHVTCFSLTSRTDINSCLCCNLRRMLHAHPRKETTHVHDDYSNHPILHLCYIYIHTRVCVHVSKCWLTIEEDRGGISLVNVDVGRNRVWSKVNRKKGNLWQLFCRPALYIYLDVVNLRHKSSCCRKPCDTPCIVPPPDVRDNRWVLNPASHGANVTEVALNRR